MSILKDLYATLSNTKSFLSLKRIERAILFCLSVGILSCYVWHVRNTISTVEIMGIITLTFGYAGFNVVMGNKDQKNEKSDTDSTNSGGTI